MCDNCMAVPLRKQKSLKHYDATVQISWIIRIIRTLTELEDAVVVDKKLVIDFFCNATTLVDTSITSLSLYEEIEKDHQGLLTNRSYLERLVDRLVIGGVVEETVVENDGRTRNLVTLHVPEITQDLSFYLKCLQ